MQVTRFKRYWKEFFFFSGLGFLLAGAWTRWLLQDQLLATGAIFMGVWVFMNLLELKRP